MTSSATNLDSRAVEVDVSEDELMVVLADGRRLSVPLAWFPRLLNATAKQRSNFELLGGGIGIHWPEIDEDLSVDGLLRGRTGSWSESAGGLTVAKPLSARHAAFAFCCASLLVR